MAMVELLDVGKNLKIDGREVHYRTILNWYNRMKEAGHIKDRPRKFSEKRLRKVKVVTMAEAKLLEKLFYFEHPERPPEAA